MIFPFTHSFTDSKEIGSKNARDLVSKAINSSQNLTIEEVHAGGPAWIDPERPNVIYMNFGAIQSLQNNASDLKVAASLSSGMTIMHEFVHEIFSLTDGHAQRRGQNYESVWKGPTVRFMNKIEKELGFAIRTSYGTQIQIGNESYKYIAFSQGARLSLIFGNRPTSGQYTYIKK